MKEYLENRITELSDISSKLGIYSNDLLICNTQIVELERALEYLNVLDEVSKKCKEKEAEEEEACRAQWRV